MLNKLLFSLILLMLCISIANAEYYVWGPEELEPSWEALNAVVQLVGSSIYVSALRTFLLLGIILLALYLLAPSRLGTVGVYAFIVLLAYLALYGPKTTIKIHDVTCDGWRTPVDCDRTVANAPAVLGTLLDIVGAINKLAEHIGVTYGSISGGFPSRVRCTEALTSLTFNKLRDTQVREDFITYITNCVVPCSYLRPSLWATIADSEDLLSALNLPAECSFLEVYDSSTGSNVLCTTFYISKIQPVLSGTVDSYLDPDWYDKVVTRFCSTVLSSNYVYGGKNNLGPELIARQAILIDGLVASLQLAGGGVEENLKARMLMTNQKLTTRAVLKAMSEWLRDVFPMIKATAQIFGIAFFPFALMLALLPNASRGLFLYFGAVIVIAFLSPAMAIANAVVNWFGDWQTSVLMYAPSTVYELRDKLWLAGAIGAVSYALIQVFLGLFLGGVVTGIWRGVFGAGSPVHLPETAKHQAADPLGAQKASAELAQRAEYERRGELVSAGMFSGAYEAQKNLSLVRQATALGMTGATAGAYTGIKQAYATAWQGSLFTKAGEWITKHGTNLAKHGLSPAIMDSGMIAISDTKTGETIATVNPITGMVSLSKPDLALSAALNKGWQKVSSTVKDESLRGAYSIAWNKTFGHDINRGIDKMSQDLETYSHTEAGSNYRQFVSRIANETRSDEQDVHRAVSILAATTGPDGELSLKEAQKAINMAAARGPGVVRAMAGILRMVGFRVKGRIEGRGSSESMNTSTYTVSSSKGDDYSVSWSKSDEWRMLTQTTASVARRYGENWTDSERQSFDRDMGVVVTLSSREDISETLGLSTGVDLQRDIDRWGREKYGYGGYLRMLNTSQGRERLLEEYLRDRLQDKVSQFQSTRIKEEALKKLYPDMDVPGSWGRFVRTGDDKYLKEIGLNDNQIKDIKAILESGDERAAYTAYLDHLIASKRDSFRSAVSDKVPEHIQNPPEDVEEVKNLNVKGISKEEVQNRINEAGDKVKSGKEDLDLPSPDRARRGVSLWEALSNVPHQAITSGLVLGLLSLGAEKGLEWLSNRLGKGKSGQNIMDELFSKKEQEELRELRERALKGDTKAAQEYLERWQKRMSELERTDPLRYKRIQKSLEELENIMEDRGMRGRVRQAVSELVEGAPQFAKRLGSALGEVAKVLGIADLLADTTPTYAPTLEVKTPYGTYNKGELMMYGLTVDDKGNIRVMENLTPEQEERLEALGIHPIPGQELRGHNLDVIRQNLALENRPVALSENAIASLKQEDPERFRHILSIQQERPVMVSGQRVLLDNEGYVYDYRAMHNAGLTVDDKGNIRVMENLTPEQEERLQRYGLDKQDIQLGYLPPDVEQSVRREFALNHPPNRD